jgi:hypothetical protein
MHRILEALATAGTGNGSVEQGLRALHYPRAMQQGTIVVITPWADMRWTDALPALVQAGSAVIGVLLDTPASGRGAILDAQADQLRREGVAAYRHTAWAF